MQLDLEEDETSDIKLILNTPLGENGGLKIAMRKLQSDSFMFNVTRNERERGRKLESSSVVLDFDLTEKLNVNYTFDYYNDDSQHNIINLTRFYTNALGAPQGVFELLGQGASTSEDLSAANDFETVYSAAPFLSGVLGVNHTLRAEYELDNHVVKLISGTNDFDELMDICSWGSSGLSLIHI